MGDQPAPHASVESLTREVTELRRRLEEAEQTIRAIQDNEVDAFVVSHGEAERVLTLDTADHPYRQYVEAMRQAAVTLSPAGTVLYANRAFARLVMRPLESVVGSSMDLFLTAACRPILNEVISRCPNGHGEALLERGDGALVPIHLTTSEFGGEPGFVCLIITDLTDQIQLAEVTAAEQLSRSILEQAVDAIVVGDRSGRLIRAGSAARQLSGINPIGLPFDEAFPLRLREQAGDFQSAAGPSWIERSLSGEMIRGVEVRLERDDGESFDLLLGAGPLSDSEGLVVGFVATLTDVTRLKKAEEALRDADRRKDEFLAMLAHELRNPLSAIGNAVRVARNSPADDTETQSWSVEVIERQVQQLGHLVDDLLDVSRIRRGKIHLRKKLIDVRAVIERAVQVSRPLIDNKGHELVLAVGDGPMTVKGDPTRLEQILVNLLSNAAKYTDNGGRITLAAKSEGGEFVARIADTGIGIAGEKLPLVFELFEQVDDSIARTGGGLGIGLTLVKWLAELHGGSVAAESAGLGRGSTFSLRIPLAEQSAELAAKAETPSPRGQAGTRILIIDDNVDSAVGLARLLRRHGYDVQTAHDGPTALEVVSEQRPAFVLLDIGLPGMDGYQIAERLRALFGEGVVICAVSGYGREEDRKKAKASGFDHHLIKPVDYDQMMTLLADAGSRATLAH